MFCNEYVMTGACTAYVAIACRFQPIGHFLTIQILTEIGAAQNQSQNSFEVANPLAAGVEATSPAWHSGLVFVRLIMHVSAAHVRHDSETCRPDRLFSLHFPLPWQLVLGNPKRREGTF